MVPALVVWFLGSNFDDLGFSFNSCNLLLFLPTML